MIIKKNISFLLLVTSLFTYGHAFADVQLDTDRANHAHYGGVSFNRLKPAPYTGAEYDITCQLTNNYTKPVIIRIDPFYVDLRYGIYVDGVQLNSRQKRIVNPSAMVTFPKLFLDEDSHKHGPYIMFSVLDHDSTDDNGFIDLSCRASYSVGLKSSFIIRTLQRFGETSTT